MKNTMRKLLALTMSFLMLFGSLPVNVIAEGISNLLPNVDDSFVVETGAADDATDNANDATRGDSLPTQENSGSFSLAGNYDIMPLAAPSSVELAQVMLSRYSATGWANVTSGDVTTLFVGTTKFIRYRIQPTGGDTGRIKVRVQQYIDGRLENDNYPIDRVGDKVANWDPDNYAFDLTQNKSTGSVYPVGFTPTADLAGHKVSFKLLVFNENGGSLGGNYSVKEGFSDEVTFDIKPEADKYDFDIQLYRAIKGDDDVYSFNSTDKVTVPSGQTIKFRLTVESMCEKDQYINLSQEGDSFTYTIDVDNTDTTQPGYDRVSLDGTTLFLPAGVTVALKPTTEKTYTSGFTYKVTAKLDSARSGTDYEYSIDKSITVTIGTPSEMYFGYNLALAGTYFESMTNAPYEGISRDADNKKSHTIGDVDMYEDTPSAGGAQKFVHQKTYAEGAWIDIVDETPESDDDNIFLFWYDKRALTENDRFLRPGGHVYKDNTNPHTIDAIWAYLPADGSVKIHDGEGLSVDTRGIDLVGENNEYSTESVKNKLRTEYSFTVVKYVNGTEVPVTKGPFETIEELEADPDWMYENTGRYAYTVTAKVYMKDGSSDPIATTKGEAEIVIMPRPVVAVANSGIYPFDGTEHDVTVAAETNQVPANSDYTVWGIAGNYFDDGDLKSDIYTILNGAFRKATGIDLSEDEKYEENDVYLTEDTWKNNYDSAVTVVYGQNRSNTATSQIYPGTYKAYIDMATDGVLSGAMPYQGDGYTVYMKDNYAYVLMDGEMEIIGSYLQVIKELKDEDAQDDNTEFTFQVKDSSGNVVSFNLVDGRYVQDPAGKTSSFSLKKPNFTSPELLVYTNDDGGYQYTVEELSPAKRNDTNINVSDTDSTDAYKATYKWALEDGTSGDGDTTDPIPMGKKATVTITNEIQPEINVTKALTVAAPASGLEENARITWTVTTTNTGKVTLHNVVVTDEKTGNTWNPSDWGSSTGTWTGGNDQTQGTLEPGETVVFTTNEYTVTAADVEAGKVTNTVKATGVDLYNNPANDEYTDESPTAGPKIEVTKAVDETSELYKQHGYKKGKDIPWIITVTNTGNVDLHDVVLTDELTGVTVVEVASTKPGRSYTNTNPLTIGEMEMGEIVTVRVIYSSVDDTDIGARKVTNPVKVTGKSPNEKEVKAEDSEEAPTIDPKLKVTKDLSEGSKEGGYKVGETITYTITVENTGNVTLHNVKLTDSLKSVTITKVTSTNPNHSFRKPFTNPLTVGTMIVGEKVTITAAYVVKQADVDAGHVYNVARATGDDPNGDPVDPDEDDEDTPTEDPRPHLSLLKVTTSKPKSGTAYRKGERITYKITVTNDGNLTLTNVVVTDELTGNKWTVDRLAPGESKSFTTSYVVKDKDVTAKSVLNVATAEGDNPRYDPDDPDNPDNPPKVPSDPSEVKDPTEATPTSSSVPRTGDGRSLLLWIALLAVSIIGMSVIAYRHKKHAPANDGDESSK